MYFDSWLFIFYSFGICDIIINNYKNNWENLIEDI